MTVHIIAEKTEGGIATDPNGMAPIPRSRCLRTIDILDLCPRAKRKGVDASIAGDLVHIVYGEIEHPTRGTVRCLLLVCFIYSTELSWDIGGKGLAEYRPAETLQHLTGWFAQLADRLGCDPEEVARTIIKYAPW